MKSINYLSGLIIIALFFSITKLIALKSPESIAYDYQNQFYIVSNVGSVNVDDGTLDIISKDGNGGTLISNLTDPKGLVIVNNLVFVCDVKSIRVIDINTKSLEQTIPITTAGNLNDICYDGEQYLYATDLENDQIFKINSQNYNVETLNVKGSIISPNGIYFDGESKRLLVVSWTESSIKEINLSDLKTNQLNTVSQHYLDGITKDRSGIFYVSAWVNSSQGSGKILRFSDGLSSEPEIVVESLSGPADIFFNVTNDTLAVPNMLANEITYHVFKSKPDTPFLLEPEDQADNLENPVHFKWRKSNGAIKYFLQICEDENFEELFSEDTVEFLTEYEKFGFESGKTYFWRIFACNLVEQSDKTEIRRFTMKTAVPDTVNLIEPENKAEKVPLKPIFRWTNSNADEYTLLLSDNINFNNSLTFETNDTTFTPAEDLKNNTLYYWKTGAEKNKIKTWSEIWSFTTESGELGEINLLIPENEKNDVQMPVIFQFEKNELAVYYILRVNQDQDVVYSDTIYPGDDILKDTVGLESDSRYCWSVLGYDVEDNEVCQSPLWCFTTAEPDYAAETDPNNFIRISPIPASEYFILNFNPMKKNIRKIEITDINGRTLFNFIQGNQFPNRMKFNTGMLSNGNYILRIIYNNNIIIKKFVILH